MAAYRCAVKLEEESADDRRGWLRRLLFTLLALALIFYVAAFFVVRTDGFRYVIEERLRDAWDWPVDVERVWLNPDLSITVAGIESADFDARTGAGLVIEEIRMDWSLRRLLHPRQNALHRIWLEGGLFSFQPDADGTWQPAAFHPEAAVMMDWLGVAPPGGMPPDIRHPAGETVWTDVRADLFWWNAEEELVASLQGARLLSERTGLVGDEIRYTRVSADTLFSEQVTRRDVSRDILSIDGHERVLDAVPSE